MSYTSGTVSGATPAVDLMTAMDTAILGVTGWSFIETTTSGNYTAKVYKSAAGNNSFGQDWYASVVRSADNGTYVFIRPSEGYDVGNHKMQKIVPSSGTKTPATTTYLNPDADVTPAGGCSSLTGSAYVGLTVGGSASYYLSVTADRIVMGSRTVGDYGLYCGLFDTVLASDPFPLGAVALGTGSGSQSATYGAATREPGQAASNAYNFYLQLISSNADNFSLNIGGSASADVYAGSAYAGRVLLRSARNPSNAVRGLLKPDVIWSPFAGVNGDTVTAGAVTYTRVGLYIFVSQAV
jgi:hypothetical protein